MIIPCIDLMEGKVVQLVQGREKVFEAKSLDDTLAAFASFQQIQVIDLDAAMGTGSNDGMVGHLTNRATVRAGGGVRREPGSGGRLAARCLLARRTPSFPKLEISP